MMMTLDRSFTIGAIGLLAIAWTLSVRADQVGLNAGTQFQHVSMMAHMPCPSVKAQQTTARDTPPVVGSMALILL
jgi:hypothetical protein